MTDRKKVVIIGSNFAGLSCAMNLSSHYAVTVIDASASFEFLLGNMKSITVLLST